MSDSELIAEEWRRVKQILADVLDQPEEKRAAILEAACGGDEVLRRRVEALIRADQEPWSFVDGLDRGAGPGGSAAAAAVLTWDLRGRRLGAYDVVEEIGRGGMGAVYLGRRHDDFDRKVAIKVARPGLADPDSIRRFLDERQIAATLEHPNIARLLDGGATPEGQPYFVMEHVEGKPLLEYCREQGLSVDARLALFQQVCAAVGFAHRNLVVHRDIKPANILVTADGTPKLLDFGIAKLLGTEGVASRPRTATLFRAMTPDYASPEQVRGAPITTATDVYSLGVVLYELLTGARPYRVTGADPGELLRVVCEADPPRPSAAVERGAGDAAADGSAPGGETAATLSRRLRGDLDAIVMKAIRKEPENRYPSVAELAEDVDRYRRALPVAARRGTLGYRAGKFARRHRAGLAAGALVAVAVVAGLAATMREERRAREAEARAQRRFQDVRKLANFFLNDFYDAIRFLPGSTPARHLLVQRGLAYLDGLAVEAGGDPSLLRELADGYEHLGNVQGGPSEGASMLGDMPGAQKSLERAIDLRAKVLDSAAATRDDRLTLAQDYSELADVCTLDGRYREAVGHGRRAVALTQRELAQGPGDDDVYQKLAFTRTNLGSALRMANRPDEALAEFRASLELYERLRMGHPGKLDWARNVFVVYYKIGAVENERGRDEESVAALRKAVSIAEDYHRRAPGNGAYTRDVSLAMSALGEALLSAKKPEEAVDVLARRRPIQQELVDADPKDATARILLADGVRLLGQARVATGERAAGRRDLEDARAILASIVAARPTDVLGRYVLAQTCAALGGASEPPASQDWFEKARSLYLGLKRDGKLNAAWEPLLADVEQRIAGPTR
ncbi:MAG TPA: serine/threonine-protein kinase [Thermoanaerobaculia bacterium]|nr:serine/threonine-protein kinase [Thermoanaerobaculia bacterium]